MRNICKIVCTADGKLIALMPDGTPIPMQVGLQVSQTLNSPAEATLTLLVEFAEKSPKTYSEIISAKSEKINKCPPITLNERRKWLFIQEPTDDYVMQLK